MVLFVIFTIGLALTPKSGRSGDDVGGDSHFLFDPADSMEKQIIGWRFWSYCICAVLWAQAGLEL